jgi:protein-disulfide isomerase
MRSSARLGLTLAFLTALAACQPRASDDAAFGQRVRAYLLSHPEVLQEVSQRLDANQADAEAKDLRAAEALLPGVRPALERDPRDLVANPTGTITVTEFYDYRCPHCVEAAPGVLALIRENRDVRFVFKEMPIFGAVSKHAARAALAVKKAGGDGIGLYEVFMTASPLIDSTIDKLAISKGARARDLEPAAEADFNNHLVQTADLFTKLKLEGTPAFIIGDRIILGGDMAEVGAAVASLRAKGA